MDCVVIHIPFYNALINNHYAMIIYSDAYKTEIAISSVPWYGIHHVLYTISDQG